jgi:hypothetical protein
VWHGPLLLRAPVIPASPVVARTAVACAPDPLDEGRPRLPAVLAGPAIFPRAPLVVARRLLLVRSHLRAGRLALGRARLQTSVAQQLYLTYTPQVFAFAFFAGAELPQAYLAYTPHIFGFLE